MVERDGPPADQLRETSSSPVVAREPLPVAGVKATMRIHTGPAKLFNALPKFTVTVWFVKALPPVVKAAGEVVAAVKELGLLPVP